MDLIQCVCKKGIIDILADRLIQSQVDVFVYVWLCTSSVTSTGNLAPCSTSLRISDTY